MRKGGLCRLRQVPPGGRHSPSAQMASSRTRLSRELSDPSARTVRVAEPQAHSSAHRRWRISSVVSGVDVTFPIRRHASGRPRRWLLGRTRGGRRQLGTSHHRFRLVVEEPVLAGLETLDVAMPGGVGVCGRVLPWRCVATADMAALSAPAQVNPPTLGLGGVTFGAAGAARCNGEVNPRAAQLVGHVRTVLRLEFADSGRRTRWKADGNGQLGFVDED